MLILSGFPLFYILLTLSSNSDRHPSATKFRLTPSIQPNSSHVFLLLPLSTSFQPTSYALYHSFILCTTSLFTSPICCHLNKKTIKLNINYISTENNPLQLMVRDRVTHIHIPRAPHNFFPSKYYLTHSTIYSCCINL